ncbi:hypothetical protein ABFA07_001289 [Porites harrisoni]
MAGMSEEHRKILQRHRVDLIKDLEPLKVLNDLSECLDEDDREAVKAKSTRGDRAEKLVDMIPRRGPKAFQCFVAALYKRQHHLAMPLIEESGIDSSSFGKADVGMTDQHKQILLSNSENLQQMNLNKVAEQLYSCGLLDDIDKQNLLSDTRQPSQRIDMLLSEILPRKGPKAFEDFARELEKDHPKLAQKLLEDAGMTGAGSSLLLRKPTPPPIQDTGHFTLDFLVQDILEDKPEVLKEFCQSMDEENLFGNGWKGLYQELDLPAGKETKMEGSAGGSTLNCIRGWVSIRGRSATVQALLAAVNRAERKDCTYILEKSLGCQLDYTDAGVKEVTGKMASLNPSEEKKVEFFGDLDETQTSEIVSRLETKEPYTLEYLRKQLTEDPGIVEMVSSVELVRQSKKYRIRKFLDSLPSEVRRDTVITIFRDVLSTYKGVTGPLLPPKKYIRDVGYSVRRNLTKELCGDDSWKVLAHTLAMDNSSIRFLQERKDNPADEVLRFWEVKSGSTVGALYNILVELGYPYIADIL